MSKKNVVIYLTLFYAVIDIHGISQHLMDPKRAPRPLSHPFQESLQETLVYFPPNFNFLGSTTFKGPVIMESDVTIQGNATIQGDTTLDSNLYLARANNTGTKGVIYVDGFPFMYTIGGTNGIVSNENIFLGLRAGNFSVTGINNTGLGISALQSISSGSHNTAVGLQALQLVTTGFDNLAFGVSALRANTTGTQNVGISNNTLGDNTTGSNNIAVGIGALRRNTTGGSNVAIGSFSSRENISGTANTAVGFDSLRLNTSHNNTAIGSEALRNNTTNGQSTAVGSRALFNATGSNNTAVGYQALRGVTGTSGGSNIAIGVSALLNLTTGGNNIVIGNSAGSNLTTESSNILINNTGTIADANTIRIGAQGSGAGQQNKTFIAGIAGANIAGGSPVVVTAGGQVGQQASSSHLKNNIALMNNESTAFLNLPVYTFVYKPEIDPEQKIHYGFLAEEVYEKYPSLVVLDADGNPCYIQYFEMIALLLNELQKARAVITHLTNRLKMVENTLQNN